MYSRERVATVLLRFSLLFASMRKSS